MEKPRYIVDENGTRTEVVLSYSEYLDLLDELEASRARRVADERAQDALIPHEQVVADLQRDGLLPD